MPKTKQKNPLNDAQRYLLNQAHRAGVTIEVALIVLGLSFFTINISSVLPGYGVVVFLAMLAASLALLIFGSILTATRGAMQRSGNPLTKRTGAAKKWLITTWLSGLAAILLLIFASPFVDGDFYVMNLVLLLAAVTLMVTAIIGSIVSIHLIWRRFNKRKRSQIRFVAYGAIAMTTILLATLGSYSTTEVVKYNSVATTDANLELGQKEVRQVGKDGERQVKHNLIFGFETSKTESAAVDEIIANGSRRYQYMYCSDGSYRYYTAEQFKDPQVGFTHQSPDGCAQNGSGTQTTIADAPPPEKIVQQVPTYRAPSSYITTCNSYSFSNSVTCRTY